jgi:uncharacterized protein YlxW (UPF0749 family)
MADRHEWYSLVLFASHGPTVTDRTITDALPAASPRSRQVMLGVTLAMLAALLVVAARSPAPSGDLRFGRKIELIELIRAQEGHTAALAARVEELSAQVARFEQETASGGPAAALLQAEVDALGGPVGLTAVHGPGVVATLTDAQTVPPGADPNTYVIHEEDLQAVVNALWSGGAEAMMVNGERVLATTAIRCVGNTLLLHGRTHSPPYVIAAVGDQPALLTALDRDPAVTRFRAAVAQHGLGFAVASEAALELSAYEGVSALRVARPSVGAG